MKKKKIFKKVYKLYVVLLTVITLFCIFNVYKILIDFEKNQPEAYIKDSLNSLSNQKISSLFELNSDYFKIKDFIMFGK